MNNCKFCLLIVVTAVIFTLILSLINISYIDNYNKNSNKLISGLVVKIREKYPDVQDEEIMSVINELDEYESDLLLSYGINIDGYPVSLKNQDLIKRMYFVDISLVAVLVLIIIVLITLNSHSKIRRIKKLTFYVEEINRKNYKLDILSNKEDSISILQNEIYKTMVMLRESADNSLEDKISLKDSLSDISHQLKTPLTSVSIMLDNILDDPNMSDDVRNDFLYDIKREIININFLVHNILKLSRFDTNTVVFKQQKINVSKLLNEVKKNVDVLGDLNDISLKIRCDENIAIKGDFFWEVEAITNIVKNSIEYSKDDGKVIVNVVDTKAYTEISIEDFGEGIDKKNLKNIFKRFYKINENDTGYGIGLSLAKMIIEQDNGRITVESEKGKGTIFIIRYVK